MEALIGWAIGMFIAFLGGLMLWKQPGEEVIEPILFIPKPPEPLPEPPKPEPIVKTNREKLYDIAYSCLGIDMAPTQDVLGCAEAWSFVAKKAGVKGLPKGGIIGTAQLDPWLAKNFTRVYDPLPGDTVISPTGSGNGTVRGHVGIVGKYKIMSNNSRTFLWDDHNTLKEWNQFYGKKGGLPVRFYRWP